MSAISPAVPLKPCLWFQSEAEPAARLYTSLFPESRITNVMRAGPAPDAPVIAVDFELRGQPFLALNGRAGSGFTDACSFVIPCETQADVDHYWNGLTAGGEEGQCGWLKDRYGVSWQVVPNALPRLLGHPDPAKAGRAMQAMLTMRKIDISALEKAAKG
jgi:predicted 3-demethylubiquinone-9 3-methyltransferase (glyoxalase superfamily)